MQYHRLIPALCALALAACSAASEEARIARLTDPAPTIHAFSACHGSNCHVRTPVSLSDDEWAWIEAIFDHSAKDPALERQQIAEAIGRFEEIIGPKTGTDSDAGRNRTDSDQSTQLDCIDESVNTTTYLTLLSNAGMLQWHDVAMPAHRRLGLIDFHNTAVVIDKEDGVRWAVDSWFGPNGAPPAVIPLESWVAGWVPANGLPSVVSAESDASGG
jgi:hypothetical protein